jgi:uncharacterized iron-regulated protein
VIRLPIAVAMLCLLLAACATPAADGPCIWSLAPPVQRVAPDEVMARVRTADILLAGEVHDNARHHAGQAAIVRAAADGDRPVVVVFEMLDRDQQAAIDAYRRGGGDAAGFAAAVDWTGRGWPDPALYRPLFDAIFAANATIVAGDLPKAAIRNVGRQGMAAAPAGLVGRFALDVPLDLATRTTLLDIQDEAHCRLLPRGALGPMVDVQRLRDAALADAVLAARSNDPAARVVLIAGAGHVGLDLGVGALLRATEPAAALLVVAFGEATAENAASVRNDAAGQADMLWLTEPAERPDPCEDLRRRFTR